MAIGEPIWGSLFFTVWAVLSQWRLGKTQALFVDIRFKIYWLPYFLLVRWPRAPEPARHPRAVCGPGPARCADPLHGSPCPRPGSGGSTPRHPRLPCGASPVLCGCVGGGVWRELTPRPRRHRRQHLKVRARAAVAQEADGRGGDQGRFPTSKLSTPVPQQKRL